MISARFTLDNPDEMRATVSLTMTVGEMRVVAAALTDIVKDISRTTDYTTGKILAAFRDVIYEADKQYVVHKESPP